MISKWGWMPRAQIIFGSNIIIIVMLRKKYFLLANFCPVLWFLDIIFERMKLTEIIYQIFEMILSYYLLMRKLSHQKNYQNDTNFFYKIKLFFKTFRTMLLLQWNTILSIQSNFRIAKLKPRRAKAAQFLHICVLVVTKYLSVGITTWLSTNTSLTIRRWKSNTRQP